MTYSIVTLYEKKSNIKDVKRILQAVAQKFDRDFAYDDCSIFDAKTNSTFVSEETVGKCKRAHAMLFDFSDAENPANIKKALQRISNSLGLYAESSHAISYPSLTESSAHGNELLSNGGGIVTVCDILSDRNSNDKGFGNNPAFGREAYDVERYSELEIERVARIAYGLAETRRRNITLADRADKFCTSQLWRKILTDINEDYPFVQVETANADNVAARLVQNPSQFDVILTPNTYGEIFAKLTATVVGNTDNIPTAMLGDTTLGMYGVTPNATPCGNNAVNVINLIISAAFMLRNSFDMQAEADCIEQAVERTMSDGCFSKGANFSASKITEEVLARI